jgi:hypothetical protein
VRYIHGPVAQVPPELRVTPRSRHESPWTVSPRTNLTVTCDDFRRQMHCRPWVLRTLQLPVSDVSACVRAMTFNTRASRQAPHFDLVLDRQADEDPEAGQGAFANSLGVNYVTATPRPSSSTRRPTTCLAWCTSPASPKYRGAGHRDGKSVANTCLSKGLVDKDSEKYSAGCTPGPVGRPRDPRAE